MKKWLLALLVLALVHVPASAGGKKNWPDLAVTKVVLKQLPGDPPYVIEDEKGHTPGFAAFVTIRNVGKATARSSSVALEFTRIGGTRIRGLSRHLPPLRPKATHVLRFAVDLDFQRHPPLGLLRVEARADSSRVVQETDDRNNTKDAPHLLPVIAHQWKVSDFMITQTLNGATLPDSLATQSTKVGCVATCSGFVFRFSTFDEASKEFEYVPSGAVLASFGYSYAPLQCTGSASDNATKDPWPGSFWIDSELDRYYATVEVRDVEPPPARAVVNCMGNPTLQVEWNWENLATYVGERKFVDVPSPYDTRLTGHTEKPTGIGNNTTTWQWTFKADVPGA
jgi:hypothetical protein